MKFHDIKGFRFSQFRKAFFFFCRIDGLLSVSIYYIFRLTSTHCKATPWDLLAGYMSRLMLLVFFVSRRFSVPPRKVSVKAESINYPIMKQDKNVCNDLHNYNLLDICFFNLMHLFDKQIYANITFGFFALVLITVWPSIPKNKRIDLHFWWVYNASNYL